MNTYEKKFFEKTKRIHGNKFDYSKTKYIDYYTHIIVICPNHGEFKVTPHCHFKNKNGCAQCSLDNRKLSLDKFINIANKKYNNKFNYSKVKYINYEKKVKIICPDHGEFEQSPHYHISKGAKWGCNKCAVKSQVEKQTKTHDQWLKQVKEKHGDKYDYSKTFYKHCEDILTIICPIHGEFKQKAQNHLRFGCNACSGRKGYTQEDFLKKAKNKFQDRFDYSKTIYVGTDNKVIIICPKHGEFSQTPYRHLKSKDGCFQCSRDKHGIKMRKSHENFIKEAKEKWGDTFDYSKTKYKTTNHKITIICRDHGPFKQAPRHHLMGANGCRRCRNGFSKSCSKWLDQIENKIGRKLIREYYICPYFADGYDEKTNTIYEYHGRFWHGHPKYYLHTDIHNVTKKTFGQLFKQTMYKELYLRNKGLNYVCIWGR